MYDIRMYVCMHVCMYACRCMRENQMPDDGTHPLTDDPKKINIKGTQIAFCNALKNKQTPLYLSLLNPLFINLQKKLKEQKSLYSVSPNFILGSDHQFYLFFSFWVGFGGWFGLVFALLLNIYIITFMESF